MSVFKKNKLSIIYKMAKEDLKEHPSLYFYREGKNYLILKILMHQKNGFQVKS